MADFGSNHAYGDSFYKDDDSVTVLAVEPVLLVAFENRAFFFSHRSDNNARREYRMGEYLRHGQKNDEFVFGG
jgi:hypothetical protein